MTDVYDARPQWLADAHAAIDGAVAADYDGCVRCAAAGWRMRTRRMGRWRRRMRLEEDALGALLGLNLAAGSE